jgi:LacI family transcriptional regulator
MTVSRVINETAMVAEATRKSVLDAIAALQYSPNTAARMLAGGHPIHMALFYDNPSSAYLSRFLVGSIDEAQRQHAQLTLIKFDSCREKKAVKELLEIGADGVILPPPLCDSEKLQRNLKASGLLAVSVAGGARVPYTPSFRINDFEAAAAMTRHILKLGHRRIGFITGQKEQIASAERARGYRAALAEAGLKLDEELIVQGQFTYRSGLIACESLLELDKPPTAVFASNDDMAAGAVAAAHRRRLEVPEDLTVCGFDDSDFARSIWPELTTIRQPISDMARAASAMLIQNVRARQRGMTPEPVFVEFPFTFVWRNSDAPPRSIKAAAYRQSRA